MPIGDHEKAAPLHVSIFNNAPNVVGRWDHPFFQSSLHAMKAPPIGPEGKPMTEQALAELRNAELKQRVNLDGLIKEMGSEHPALVKNLHLMAYISLRYGQFADALGDFKKLLSIQTRLYGPSSLPVANVYLVKTSLLHGIHIRK